MQYLCGIIRDMEILSFDDGSDLFIESVEFLEENITDHSLFDCLTYGIINFRKSLSLELEKNL
jgi:hypothetical protein